MILRSDGNFEDDPNAECADLRLAIVEANEAGDVSRLAELRSLYRHAAHGGQGRTSAPHVPAAPRTSQAREFDPERGVAMTVARFGHLAQAQLEDGEPYWWSIMPGAFDRWRATHRASDCVFSLEHEPTVGVWSYFDLSDRALWGSAHIDEGPIGDEMLEACRSVLWGCSVNLDVVRTEQRSERGPNGWPVWDLLEVDLVDAGPVSSWPGDDQCRILSVGFNRPWWRSLEAKHERHLRLGATGIIRPAGGATWRPKFGA